MADMTEKQMLEEFRKSFPKGAIQVNKFSGQIGIKPQYIVERLNDVCGVGGWDMEIISIGKDEITDDNKTYYSVICELEVQIVNKLAPDNENPFGKKVVVKSVRAHGGGGIVNGRIADAYKSAKTDAFGKACSYLEIATDAYKGDLEDPNKEKMEKAIAKPKTTKKSKYQELVKIVKINNVDEKKLTEVMDKVLEEKGADPRELTGEQYKLVIDEIKKDKNGK